MVFMLFFLSIARSNFDKFLLGLSYFVGEQSALVLISTLFEILVSLNVVMSERR